MIGHTFMNESVARNHLLSAVKVRTSASGRKRSDRHSVLSSPSSQKSIDRKAVFEEWPLGNAVLKRVTVGGTTTFQVQFTWDSCATYGRKDRATEDPQDTYPVRRSPSLRRGGAAGPHFTPEDTLIELTDDDVQSPALTEEEAEWEFEKILGLGSEEEATKYSSNGPTSRNRPGSP
ncbi:hypothetical protein F4824DRAFT_35622 [Ustulina deusta]|nr:hypothetical protein F4824DRAFT_35622 [Ustulina deusta]